MTYSKSLANGDGSGYFTSQRGTKMYMAPEVFVKNETYQGQDADLFAFGVLLLVLMLQDYPWKDFTDKSYKQLT